MKENFLSYLVIFVFCCQSPPLLSYNCFYAPCCKRVSGHIRAHLAMRAGGYHYSLFHYFTSAYPVQFEHFLDKPQTGW